MYTREERERILDYLEQRPQQNCYVWAARLMFCFDCRIGEVKALKWEDYYPDKFAHPMMLFHSQVIIDRTISGKYYLNELDYTKAKSADGARLQPVTERARKILDEIRATHPTSEFILTTEYGNPIYHTDRVNDVLKEACTVLGISYHSSHRCRNYSITEQAREGFDVNTIAQNSGHVDKNTTLGYMRQVYLDESDIEKWDKIHG